MEIKYLYEDVWRGISYRGKPLTYPSENAVLENMTGELPATAWADIEILDWLPEDDTQPVNYGFADTRFGRVLVANTRKGVCYIGLINGDDGAVLADFNKRFGHTLRTEERTDFQKQALDFLDGRRSGHITLHLRGTSYQTGIWRRLIRIPFGKVVSYATLAGDKDHSRAAGAANGRNPVFWIVPCHRAVKSDGSFDRYFWGEDIKKRLLAWELTNCNY